jgi:DNA-binding transcriptional LysR family regulator
MAQPPLSVAIRKLERELGTELLTRTTREVRLTDAGAMFLAGARESSRSSSTPFRPPARSGPAIPTSSWRRFSAKCPGSNRAISIARLAGTRML